MKILKRLGIIIVVLVVLFFVVGLILPSKYHFERSTEIDAPQAVVFNQINNLKNWSNWSPWFEKDPDMKLTFEGEEGYGAKYSWESDHEHVGSGTLEIIESVENKSIKTALDFGENGKGNGFWNLEPTENGGTKATWGFDTEAGMNIVLRYMFVFVFDKWMAPDFEKGLANLKAAAEAAGPEDLAIEISVEQHAGLKFLGMKSTCQTDSIGIDMGKVYTKLAGYLKEKQIQPTGPSLSVYYAYSPESIEYEAGFPINAEGVTVDDDQLGISGIPAGKYVKAIHMGHYEGLKDTHEAINAYISNNGLNVIGAPWEEYVKDMMSEPDTTKWMTFVYYPVE